MSAAVKVLLVGMEKWWLQDVSKVEMACVSAMGIPAANIRKLRDPTAQTVTQTIAEVGKTAPSTLVFYYSGHGNNEGGRFCMNTHASELTDSMLMDALGKSGAKKVLVILDACHAGAFAVKNDIQHRLNDLALHGSGIAVVAACGPASTTPGTSPLTTHFLDVVSRNRGVLEPLSLCDAVKLKVSEAELILSKDFRSFNVTPGLTVTGRCMNQDCTHSSQGRQPAYLGFGQTHSAHHEKGSHNLIGAEFPCPWCRRQLKRESLHFNECQWRVTGKAYETAANALNIGSSGSPVVSLDTGNKSSLKESQFDLPYECFISLSVQIW